MLEQLAILFGEFGSLEVVEEGKYNLAAAHHEANLILFIFVSNLQTQLEELQQPEDHL